MPNILMTGTGPVEAPGIPTNGWFAGEDEIINYFKYLLASTMYVVF